MSMFHPLRARHCLRASLPAPASYARSHDMRRLLSQAQAPRSSPPTDRPADIRSKLMQELKVAMKDKDRVKSTVIRSVLSEVYAADKTPSGTPASSSAITSIIRRAITRRFDAATQFESAARPDLAHKEREEAVLLESFLPPLLPEADIDRVLQHVLSDPALADARSKGPPQRALGLVLKAFYTQVDKSTVDPELVRQRAQALLQ
ncbi:Yqey-like protein-domain-containing protein [Cubamyces lactineus]|nr:Yqey-like protein-domain-containing protein [Cubamyces lactineus]